MSFCSLEGKVALVTGASRGIGAAVAKRLAQAGATVIVNYKSNASAAEALVNEIRQISPRSKAMAFDVANADEVDRAVESLTQEFEAIHILVCNAGISRDVLLPRSTPEDFQSVLATNLMGAINPVRALSRPMMRNRYGRIVCIGSIIGEIGNKGQSPYAASKAALFGFAKSVALELGSRNVTCNVICPGFIDTEMTQTLPEELKKAYFDRIPVGRFGSAEEVASSVQFLVSNEAAYITGATLDINGGLVMR